MKNKWWTVALAVSLLINFALVGYVLGRSGLHAGPPPINPTLGFARVIRQLPEQRQEELRPFLRQYLSSMRPGARGMRTAHKQLAAALLENPINPAVIASTLANISDQLGTGQAAGHQLFIELVSKLTLTERKLMVEHMSRRGMRRHRMGQDHNRR